MTPLVLPALNLHPWAYPVLEVLHIVGIALLLGNLVLFELRVWGLAATLPLLTLARLALGLSLAGFTLLVSTGLLMFATQPNELLANRAFTLKLGFIALAGLNAAWFHARGSLSRPMPAAGRHAASPEIDLVGRLLTVLSLGLWLAVILCGRWIAYV